MDKKEKKKKRRLTELVGNWYRRFNKSLSLRIVKNYLKFSLITGILMLVVFIPVYLLAEFQSYDHYGDEIVVALEGKNNFGGIVNTYYFRDIRLRITNSGTGVEVYNDQQEQLEPWLGFVDTISFNSGDDDYYFIISTTKSFVVSGTEYSARIYYNMTDRYHAMWSIVKYMLAAFAIILVFIINEAKRENVKILRPIDNVTDQISRLSVQNLSSLRLNVEGTSDELRELAVVFNRLLDRIDESYENQKLFVSNASHELRTPIAVVLGYANMLKRWGSRNEEVLAESVDAIKNEATEMQELVNKLLILSRADKKTFKLTRERFDMAGMVEELVKETEMVVENRKIECPALEHVEVFGDRQSLKQAIRIFVENAVKYSEDGDSIRISCMNRGGDAVVTVEDTGIGMQQKDMDSIFVRFYRSDDVRDRKIGGHGLGLAIAKMIVMSHAGWIRVRSQYTVGTSFTVTIPKEKKRITER